MPIINGVEVAKKWPLQSPMSPTYQELPDLPKGDMVRMLNEADRPPERTARYRRLMHAQTEGNRYVRTPGKPTLGEMYSNLTGVSQGVTDDLREVYGSKYTKAVIDNTNYSGNGNQFQSLEDYLKLELTKNKDAIQGFLQLYKNPNKLSSSFGQTTLMSTYPNNKSGEWGTVTDDTKTDLRYKLNRDYVSGAVAAILPYVQRWQDSPSSVKGKTNWDISKPDIDPSIDPQDDPKYYDALAKANYIVTTYNSPEWITPEQYKHAKDNKYWDELKFGPYYQYETDPIDKNRPSITPKQLHKRK
jgi:hypothetical protein